MTITTNATSALVTAGGTDAPAALTSQNWTVTTVNPWPVLPAGDSIRIIDLADVGKLANYEIMDVTVLSNGSSVSWTATRGVEDTIPHSHATGWTAIPVLSAGYLNSFGAEGHDLDAGATVYVDDFGADPTGVLDSTHAFNAALAALPQKLTWAYKGSIGWNQVLVPMGIIRFGSGDYMIGSRVTLPDLNMNDTGPGVRVFGAGWQATVLWYFGSTVCASATNSVGGPFPPSTESEGGPGGIPITPYPVLGARGPGNTGTGPDSAHFVATPWTGGAHVPENYESTFFGGGKGGVIPLLATGAGWFDLTIDGSYISGAGSPGVITYSTAAPGNTRGIPWSVGGPVGYVTGGGERWRCNLHIRNFNCPTYGASAAALVLAAQPHGAGGWSAWVAPNMVGAWNESNELSFYLQNCDSGVCFLGKGDSGGSVQNTESFNNTHIKIRSQGMPGQPAMVMDGGAWLYHSNIELYGGLSSWCALTNVVVPASVGSSSITCTAGVYLTPTFNGCLLALRNADRAGGILHGIIQGAQFGSKSFTLIITTAYGTPTTSATGLPGGTPQTVPVVFPQSQFLLQLSTGLGGAASITDSELTVRVESGLHIFTSNAYLLNTNGGTTTTPAGGLDVGMNPTSINVIGLKNGVIAGTPIVLGTNFNDVFIATATVAGTGPDNVATIPVQLWNVGNYTGAANAVSAKINPTTTALFEAGSASNGNLNPYAQPPSTIYVDDAAGCQLTNVDAKVHFSVFGTGASYGGMIFTSSGGYPPSPVQNFSAFGQWEGDPAVSSNHSVGNGSFLVLGTSQAFGSH